MNKAQEIASFSRHELEKEIEWLLVTKVEMEVLIDILWEYVSEKDYEEINKRLEEHENSVGKTQTRV